MVVFPLTFLANTFVPLGGLPDGLREFAEWNPISAVAAAVRTLFGNPAAIPADAAWPLAAPGRHRGRSGPSRSSRSPSRSRSAASASARPAGALPCGRGATPRRQGASPSGQIGGAGKIARLR